jgi:putative transposase
MLVAEYNARAHRALPKVNDPETGKSRHMTPDEALAAHRAKGWEPLTLVESEAQNVFRPRLERTVQRGEVSIFNQRYFSALLEEFNGERVHVAYDIHDAQHVWIHHLDGRLICTAEFGANQQHYFPVSVIEQAREQRADARAKRLEAKLDEVEAERKGQLLLDDTIVLPGSLGVINRAELDALPLAIEPQKIIQMPESPTQRFNRWQSLDELATQGGALSGDDLKFYTQYQKGSEWKALMRQKDEANELALVRFN